uniref:Uncharacterized protein n=1 Tax=Aegilops tauschii subsp. strangulata TaxID=200361 RepID=A0A452Y9C5_AEGTS
GADGRGSPEGAPRLVVVHTALEKEDREVRQWMGEGHWKERGRRRSHHAGAEIPMYSPHARRVHKWLPLRSPPCPDCSLSLWIEDVIPARQRQRQ